LRAIAENSEGTSNEIDETYTITHIPVLSVNPSGGTFTDSVKVALAATNGGTIYYTTDGSTPDNTSTEYTDTLKFTTTTRLRAIAENADGSSSEIDETYNITHLPVLSVNPSGGTYNDSVKVALTATAGATIYYTTDGSAPDNTSTEYTDTLKFTSTTRLRAIAENADGSSNEIDETYTIKNLFDVHFKNTDNWSEVYIYIFDKNDSNNSLMSWHGVPMVNETSSLWYKYTISETVDVGIVFNNNNNGKQSEDQFRDTTGWFVYDVTDDADNDGKGGGIWYDNCPGDCPGVPILTVTPAGGTYSDSVKVALTATNGGTIYYTTDGSAPDNTSTEYADTLKYTSTTRLRAIAENSEGLSNEIDETYTITDLPVLSVNPVGGMFADSVKVTLTATKSAVIYYTLDGSAPGNTSDIYNDTLRFLTDTRLRAVAYNTDGVSNEIDENYVIIHPPVLSVNPVGGIFADSVIVELTSSDNSDIYYTLDGSAPDNTSNLYSERLKFKETVRLRAVAYNSGIYSNEVDEIYNIVSPFDIHFKNTNNWNDVYVYLFDSVSGKALVGDWPGTIMTQEGSSVWYKFTIIQNVKTGIVFNNNNNGQQSEDQFRDSNGWYVLNENKWYDTCPGDCPGSPELVVDPLGGTFNDEVVVNLYATYNGVIYYTVDGSEPDNTSNLYEDALTFTETTQLRAVAYNENGVSNEINETYTVINTSELPVLTVNPEGGTYSDSVVVSLSATNEGEIYYTTNGEQPDYTSQKYSGTIILKTDTRIRAIAYNSAGQSNEIDELYEIIFTGINLINTGNNIQVYPNPFINEIKIKLKTVDNNVNVVITDLSGKVVFNKTGIPTYNYFTIDLNNVPKGVYILKITGMNIEMIKKIIKK
jgi:hypothetical protein